MVNRDSNTGRMRYTPHPHHDGDERSRDVRGEQSCLRSGRGPQRRRNDCYETCADWVSCYAAA